MKETIILFLTLAIIVYSTFYFFQKYCVKTLATFLFN